MTNKIASEVLKASPIQQMSFCKVIVDGKAFSVKEALNTAVKILEQQPCEDAVSRQVVIKLLSYDWANRPAHKAVESIRNLPSVTPKEKTGKWIYKDQKGQFCSACDKPSFWKFGYCPNCGAKMEVI